MTINVIEIADPDSAETPSLAEVIRTAKNALKTEMSICSPAKVVKYDPKKQVVDVIPVFRVKYLDGTIEEPPVIYNVPVVFPRAGAAFISFPLKKDDHVLLVFADRSIEKWQTTGEINYPEDVRMHHLSDAFAIPGGYPLSNTAKVANGDDLIVANASCEVRVKPNGHFQVLAGGEELVKVMNDFMQASVDGDQGGQYDAIDRLKSFLES